MLLLHQLPPKPDYLRVKVRRRFAGLGAALVKSSVYVLRNTPESLEDFQRLRQEIEAAQGSALIARAEFVEGISDDEIETMLRPEHANAPPADVPTIPDHVAPGRTWVTRQGVFVDRIASARLIRRFIDPDAQFRFVAEALHRPRTGELRFDMVGAEYTHVGEDCTLQTLVERFGLNDHALRAIGEVVHDIDCKDEKFARPEGRAVVNALRRIADSTDDDDARVTRGFTVFEDLYEHYSASETPHAKK